MIFTFLKLSLGYCIIHFNHDPVVAEKIMSSQHEDIPKITFPYFKIAGDLIMCVSYYLWSSRE